MGVGMLWARQLHDRVPPEKGNIAGTGSVIRQNLSENP